MKVVFLLRQDANEKPGGDTTKVKRYVHHLSRLGCDARVTTRRSDLKILRPDIVHLVNLDLPAENLANAVAARKVGAKVALSTIRHPFNGVLDFYSHGQDVLYNVLSSLHISPNQGIGLREIIKLSKNHNSGLIYGFRRYSDIQQRLLDHVDVILPMAPGERQALCDDFDLSCELRTVENALSFELEAPTESEKKFDVACVGRIEPRKNSLALARLAARERDVHVAFAGQINLRHRRYAQEFLKIASKTANISYLGVLPHAEVRRTLKQSQVYLNPAWFEVVSQADFEAISVGLPISTTVNSYLPDFVSGATWLSPTEFSETAASDVVDEPLRRIVDGSCKASINTGIRSWAMVGDELARIYSEVLK